MAHLEIEHIWTTHWEKEWMRLLTGVGNKWWDSDHPHGSPVAEEDSLMVPPGVHWKSSGRSSELSVIRGMRIKPGYGFWGESVLQKVSKCLKASWTLSAQSFLDSQPLGRTRRERHGCSTHIHRPRGGCIKVFLLFLRKQEIYTLASPSQWWGATSAHLPCYGKLRWPWGTTSPLASHPYGG